MGEQPIFSCKAHVFHIDPKTKKSWVPASTTAISVSFFFDSTRSLYRIISVEGTKAVINSTVTPSMAFTKTSQKFGQWSDVRANTVYGLGFPSEAELNKFIEKFHEVKEATKNVGGGAKAVLNGGSSGNQIMQPTNSVTSANASPIQGRSMGNSPAPTNQDDEPYPPITDSHLTEEPSSLQIKGQYGTHQRSQSLSGSYQSATLESPTKKTLEKNHIAAATTNASNTQTLPSGGNSGNNPGAVEAQLKYENERLKLALAQSSANAKKWEVELATLKSNNARLTAALQESTANVEEWKRQLQAFKEENASLKAKVMESESGKGEENVNSEARREAMSLRLKCETLESELKSKDDKIRSLNAELGETTAAVEDLKKLNDESQKHEAMSRILRGRLENAMSGKRAQSNLLETLRVNFLEKLKEIEELQEDITRNLEI